MVVLIVHMKVKPGTEDECKRLIRLMEENTRREPGCIQYVGHQSLENPQNFSFYESYHAKQDLEAHWATPHFKQYVIDGLNAITVEKTKELWTPVSE